MSRYQNERERTLRKVNHQLLEGIELTESGYPVIHREELKPFERFIGFNEVKTEKVPHGKGVHFFIDDYQFERIWETPERYLERLSEFSVVLSPDFSLYTDYPEPVQRWNHYRSQLIGAACQKIGINVIPTVSWADKKSYSFCFEGIEKGSIIAVSTVGIARHENTAHYFTDGLYEAVDRIKPEKILIYGKIPGIIDTVLKDTSIEVIFIRGGIGERTKHHGR